MAAFDNVDSVSWFDYIKLTPEKEWDYDDLSLNPNITWDIVSTNPDKPWNYSWLSRNPNITWVLNRLDDDDDDDDAAGSAQS